MNRTYLLVNEFFGLFITSVNFYEKTTQKNAFSETSRNLYVYIQFKTPGNLRIKQGFDMENIVEPGVSEFVESCFF